MTRLVLAAALLVACGKADSGPPCDKVVDHMMELTKQMMPGHDPDSLGNRKQLVDECVKRKMSAATRKCIMATKEFNELGKCTTPGKPDTAPAPGTAPPSPAPAPVAPQPEPGSGSAG